MLLGFVSLLLVVFQDLIQKICVDKSLMEPWWPCLGVNDDKASVVAAGDVYSSLSAIGFHPIAEAECPRPPLPTTASLGSGGLRRLRRCSPPPPH